jgi:hypothetical protein
MLSLNEMGGKCLEEFLRETVSGYDLDLTGTGLSPVVTSDISKFNYEDYLLCASHYSTSSRMTITTIIVCEISGS